ncbi:MAG: tyrosine-type recombinase/integrase [Acidobacteriota bacterium]
MRKRFQKGNLEKVDGVWIARWRDGTKRRAQRLGRCSEMTKAAAQSMLASILAPINNRSNTPTGRCSFREFVQQVYLPFYRRKWKRSTTMTNEDRIRHHLTAEFATRSLDSFDRDALQELLDRKGLTLSFSVVNHLRWDTRQIFGMAVAEGYLPRNPALLLFTPRGAKRAETRIMSIEDVRTMFSVLDVRERLVARLAVLAGMRPGEIFGLTWARLEAEYADIRQRVYRGEVDTPKSVRSVRWAALSDGLRLSIGEWRNLSLDVRPEAWVFPSERMVTPVAKDNCWRRGFAPRLKPVGLEWANFQVMRRTHSSLLKELDVDPQIRAEQMGHSVDVNENVYTQVSFARRQAAVNSLEKAIGIM